MKAYAITDSPSAHSQHEVEEAAGMATGEQDREPRDDHRHHHREPEEHEQDVMRDREQPFHQCQPSVQPLLPVGTDVTRLSPSLAPGSGAIVSTAQDVADFYRALLSGRLLEPKELQEMTTTVSLSTGKVVATGPGMGLGIGRPPSSCGVAWSHAGELPGYDVAADSSGDGRRQAVLMMNQNRSTLPKRTVALFDRLVEKAYCSRA